jgi:hypothetical protein
MKNNKYYIYLHIKLDTGEPFYIGKGSGRRAYQKRSRSEFWHNIVTKHGYDIILLEEELTNEEANQVEIYWIKRIGRRDLGLGPLVNLTDGGEGIIGQIVSNETKLKMSNAHIGIKKTDEHKKNISKGRTGIKFSNKHKLNMSITNKGKPKSEETKKKMSDSQKGKIKSEEHRKKLSESHKGKTLSQEHKLKISKSKLIKKY